MIHTTYFKWYSRWFYRNIRYQFFWFPSKYIKINIVWVQWYTQWCLWSLKWNHLQRNNDVHWNHLRSKLGRRTCRTYWKHRPPWHAWKLHAPVLESNYFPNFFPGMVESSTALAGNAMKRYSHPLAKEVWTLLLSQIILMGLVGFKIGGFFNYWWENILFMYFILST